MHYLPVYLPAERSFMRPAIALLFLSAAIHAEKLSTTGHHWEAINFPRITTADGTEAQVYLKPENRGLDFRMLVSTDDRAPVPAMFRNKTVSARLHLPGGRTVLPSDDMLNAGVGASNAGSTTWNAIAYFPWSTNQLEEAWLELRVGTEEFWLEVPCGFTTDPALVNLTATNALGTPMKAPAVKPPDRKHLLLWQSVEYDLGKIQNGWSLSARQSNENAWDIVTEVILYHDPSQTMGWDLHTPRTAMQIRGAKGRVAVGRCFSLVEHDDKLRRSDTFKTESFGGSIRDWGTLEITVENQVYETPIPASLYRARLGHASE
jgi:hypothetical protein